MHDLTARHDEDGRIQMGRGGERVSSPELPHDQLHRADKHIQRNGRLSVVAIGDEEEGEASYAAGSEGAAVGREDLMDREAFIAGLQQSR